MSHPGEHVIVFEPDQAARAAELMLWQHQDKARLMAFVAALGAGAQLAESTSWAVIVGGSVLEAAQGATLDRWGELVGEERGGLNHEQYLLFIGLRIRVNTEHPGEEAMYSVLAAAVEPSAVTRYLLADGIVYIVSSESFLPGSVAAHAGALIRDFRPAGIYSAITEQASNMIVLGALSSPKGAVTGTIIGTIAAPSGYVLGRVIYSGR